jgi:hypothetical protein
MVRFSVEVVYTTILDQMPKNKNHPGFMDLTVWHITCFLKRAADCSELL